MAFSFGTPANANKTASPFGGFGSSTPAQGTGSLFGNQQNNASTPNTGFSFGNPNANNAQAQNSSQVKPAFSFGGTTASTGSNNTSQPFSFGASTNTNNASTGGGLFGGGFNNAAGAGNTSQQGGLFGQQNNTSSSGGSLFGQQNTNSMNSNGLFGQNNGNNQPAQNNTGTGLFEQQNTSGGTTGLFGQSNNAQTGGLFGNPQQGSTTSGLFGQANNAQTQQSNTGGIFGGFGNNQNLNQNLNQNQTQSQNQNQNQNQSQAQNSLFTQSQQPQSAQMPQTAQTPQPSLAHSIYGQKSSQPQFSWSRPAQTSTQPSMPSFNMPSLSLAQSKFNPAQSYNPSVGVSTASTYGPSQPASIQDQLTKIKNAWDPTNPDCMFQAYFYNRVAPETASLYTKPEDHKQAAWDAAVADRPDNSVVPVLAKGFADLQVRLNGQEQQVAAYRTRIHEIANKLKELSERHTLHATPKIDTARRRHIEISRRALQLATKVQVLKCRGYALRPEEEQLRTQLLSLEKQLHEPKTFGRVDELWAKMTLVRLQQRSTEEDIKARGFISTIDFDSGSGLSHIETVLQDHHNGIEFISRILKEDLAKVQEQVHKYSSSQAGLDKSKGRT